MSWVFKIASDLIKEAMSSEPEPESAPRDATAPQQSYDVLPLIARHRAEIDRNLEAVVGMLNAQNERQLQAAKLQKRWNYALAAGLIVVLVLVVVSIVS
jgi:hypothetical protein